MRKFTENIRASVDLGVVIMIGIAFAGLTVMAYLIWVIFDQLAPHAPTGADSATYNSTYQSLSNVTGGFDDAVNLLLVAITIFILAIAISALLMLRGR